MDIQEYEVEFIKNNNDIMQLKDILKELKISDVKYKYILNKYKIPNKKRVIKKPLGQYKGLEWSEYEINYLTENYSKYSAKEIAKTLNRSYHSIMAKVKRLGLYK